MEVVALDFVGDASELSEALAALSMPHVVVPALSGGWGAALSRAAHGTYIQWLLPGDRLFPEKIVQMATALELDDELDFVIADAARAADDALPPFVFRMKQPHCVVAAGAWHRKFVLSAGASPEGGLSGALLRRSVLDACAWLETAFFRAHFFPLAAFMLLFQTRGDFRVGVFEIPLLTHEVQEAAELPWHPAEWAALLLSCGGELEPEVFQKARASLAERAQDVFRREDACRVQDFVCARKVFEEIFSQLPE